MKKFLIGAGLAALVVTPALALQQDAQPNRPDRMATMTRADVQARVQQRFSALDTNRDGVVTKAEAEAAQALKQQERQAKRAEHRDRTFAARDIDGNGQLSKQEFAAKPAGPDRGATQGRGHRGKGHMRMGMRGGMGERMFAMMDANKDGKVTLDEASARPLAMFDRADANKDGKVTPEERRAARQAMRQSWAAKRG
jgi:hypothetical protein